MTAGFGARVDAAVGSLAGLPRPTVGVVLGSGLGGLVDRLEGDVVPYAEIAGFPVPTTEGHRGLLKVAPVAAPGGRRNVALMAGRFHHYEGRTMDDVVLPVFVLAAIGVETLVVTNAAGAVNRRLSPGDLVLISDHLNLMGVNPLVGPLYREPRFPDMSGAYDPRLRAAAREAAGKPLAEGVYAALSGPCYETPAEIRMLRALGADLVGMSTVPEVIAARSLELSVLGISCVTNMAAGILDQPLSHQEVMETGRRVADDFAGLVLRFLASA